jgi:hypothetical protein
MGNSILLLPTTTGRERCSHIATEVDSDKNQVVASLGLAMSLASISLGWRKIKADLRGELTETSIIGSLFSVAAACLIIFLVYSQVDAQNSTLIMQPAFPLTHNADQGLQNNKERIERCFGPL